MKDTLFVVTGSLLVLTIAAALVLLPFCIGGRRPDQQAEWDHIMEQVDELERRSGL